VSKGRTLPGTFHDEMGRSKMKKWLSEVAPLAVTASLALIGAAWAGGTDDFGCSNATLDGEYAFGVTVYTPAGPPFPPPSTVVVNGIKVFDAGANSPSVIIEAITSPERTLRRQGRKRAPIRSIRTAPAAW
jgi:hypothetical protein